MDKLIQMINLIKNPEGKRKTIKKIFMHSSSMKLCRNPTPKLGLSPIYPFL
jgi:hypothetical protein